MLIQYARLRRARFAVVVVVACSGDVLAQIERDVDLPFVRRSIEAALPGLDAQEAAWRERFRPRPNEDQSFAELFGYDPPGRALQIAYLHAFLFAREGDDRDAVAAAAMLRRMADYRDAYPAAMRAARVEYADGLPAVPSFFQLADYAEAWSRVRGCGAIDVATRGVVEDAIASSADFVLVFPEWGAHNRAMLRAESLLHAAKALPDHDGAARWRRMADILAADSLGRFEIEDAQIYHPIWLLALFRYAEAAGRDDVFASLPVRYYLRYFTELLTPAGNLPAFGDAWWGGGQARYYQVLAWGAAELHDPELQWAADRVYRTFPPVDPEVGDLGRASIYAHLAGHLDSDLVPREPVARSGLVLDDVIGKKVVLRDGYHDDDFYLCLNYRDEGDWGTLHRDFLRQTLAVEEEKMHHGHADEQSVVLWMHEGAVLLHDAGYRDRAPSGPFGAYRAEVFHNRLVARRGRPGDGQDVFEFLRDNGAYRPVRTELIDFIAFELGDYSRTRLHDDARGYVWDRVLIRPRGAPLVVVVDTVEVERDGDWTLSALWATQEVVARGAGYAVGRTTSIRDAEFPDTRRLLVLFPGRDDAPSSFPLMRHTQDEQVVHATLADSLRAGERRTLVTVLESLPRDADPVARRDAVRRVEATPDRAATAIDLELGGARWSVLIKNDLHLGLSEENVRPRYAGDGGILVAGDLRTDADVLIVRRDQREIAWCAANMTEVTIDGQAAFEAKPLQLFQVTGRSDIAGKTKWRRWSGTLPVPKGR